MTQDTPEPGPEPTTESSEDRMGDVDHTHPHADTTFGSIFGRGPTIAADGGEPVGTDASGSGGSSSAPGTGGGSEGATGGTSMADVRHVSPTGTEASGAFERGGVSATDAAGGVGSDE